MPDELKPCPFCGGEAEYNCFPTDYPTEHCCAYVVCTKCRAEINREGRVGDTRRLKEQAIDAWNRRAQQPNEPLTVEQLRQMVGSPIWISGWNRYGILGRKGVDADDDGKPIYRYVVGFAHGWEWLEDVLDDRKAYVRPPKVGENE